MEICRCMLAVPGLDHSYFLREQPGRPGTGTMAETNTSFDIPLMPNRGI